MKESLRIEWIRPVLEDIREFLREGERPDMANDIDMLIEKYRDILMPPTEDTDDELPDNAVPLDRYRPRT
ncbi:hypothetical protein ROJ8625_03862 [Roseivivax jejudonensis]|uniref:Uncharacterized protein n=1 Tax=Roseivivax jejudonensis TaxID=1529041 RepID=A0A1X7A895_9RHOB|nr:hypothetical protein [Roseivivax jejudonensis]SLN72648.1 hypothetical protein ROJ8625_03862 [Roseivivax jejudonensis]